MAFVFLIDGVDFSDCIMQRQGIVETPVYKNGINAGVSKIGTPIWDRVNTLYTFEIPCKPLPRARYAALAAACAPNSVQLTYNSFRSASTVTATAQLTLAPVQYAMEYGGTKIYYGAKITAELAS